MRIGQLAAFVNLPRIVQLRMPRIAGYQALPESEMREDVETAHRSSTPGAQVRLADSNVQWAPICRLSSFYGEALHARLVLDQCRWPATLRLLSVISFLCNALLVLLGCAGWQISSDRDSNQTTKNSVLFEGSANWPDPWRSRSVEVHQRDSILDTSPSHKRSSVRLCVFRSSMS